MRGLRQPTSKVSFHRAGQRPSLKRWALAILFTLAGCAEAQTPTRVPTLTLIPPTATHTPTPVTPSPTPVSLPGPADLVTPSSDSEIVSIPASAQPLLQRALDNLAQRLSVSAQSIRVLRLETAVWSTLDLGCGEEPLNSSASLEIKGFRFVLHVDGENYEYHTDSRAAVRLCDSDEGLVGQTETLLDADPLAADMVAVAQRRLSAEFDLPARRIRVIDVMPVVWTDSSLGCPQPNVNYPSVTIAGYRIVLAVGDEEYIFHTDSTQALLCDPENERLPIVE